MQLLEFNNNKISPLKGIFRKKEHNSIFKCLEYSNPCIIKLNKKDMPLLKPGKNLEIMMLSKGHIYINNHELSAVKDKSKNSKIIFLGFFIEIKKHQEITPQVKNNNTFIPDRIYQVKVMPSNRSSTGYGIWGFTLLTPKDTFYCEGFTDEKIMWNITNENGFAKIQKTKIE